MAARAVSASKGARTNGGTIMKYHWVPHAPNRKMIVNHDRSKFGNDISSHLNEIAHIIKTLRAHGCPLNTDCVNLTPIDGKYASSICDHLTRFIPSQSHFKAVNCNFQGKPRDLFIEMLSVESCPADHTQCVGCSDLRVVIIPMDTWPKDSHAHVACI